MSFVDFAESAGIAEKLKRLPASPGVYIMRSQGAIIYVGKAVSLKNRVRSYFAASKNHSQKVAAMVDKIDDFEVILCDTELEALILENNLIKKHQPFYNILLKDGKTYPYLCVDMKDAFPILQVVRQVDKDDGCRYFGPYFGANMIRDLLDTAYEVFPMRTCTRSMDKTYPRACIRHEIGLCPAPCIGACTRGEYAEKLASVISFLSGNMKDISAELTARMNALSADMQYEQAAVLRDRLRRIEQLGEKQQAFSFSLEDRDAVAIATIGPDTIAQVLYVREGRLVGSESYTLENLLDESAEAVMRGFLLQHYDESRFVPKEIIIESACEQIGAVEGLLEKLKGGGVKITLPQRGEKLRLARLAKKNAEENVKKRHDQLSKIRERTIGACEELGGKLGIPAPYRIECYDISNFQGAQSVGSMVVFTDGAADKKEYRIFKIKTVDGPNDFASMVEVITRRFSRYQSGDASFANMPDLVLIDGGKGQLSAAVEAFSALGLAKKPYFFGLAKRFEEIFRPESNVPIIIDRHSNALHLLQRVRDEAHRFAITRHKSMRGQKTMTSKLDAIPGIGPARRRALLTHFRTLTAISQAAPEQLLEAQGMSKTAARSVYDFFHTETPR